MLDRARLEVSYNPTSGDFIVTTTDQLDRIATMGTASDVVRLATLLMNGANELLEMAIEIQDAHLGGP